MAAMCPWYGTPTGCIPCFACSSVTRSIGNVRCSPVMLCRSTLQGEREKER